MRTTIVAFATSVIALAACSDSLGPAEAGGGSSIRDDVTGPLATTSALAPMPNKPAAFIGFTSRPFNTKATYLSSSGAEGWSGDEASSPFTIVTDASAPA